MNEYCQNCGKYHLSTTGVCILTKPVVWYPCITVTTPTALPLPPTLEARVREVAEELQYPGESRCGLCGWPLSRSADLGCVRRDCSFRGERGAGAELKKLNRARIESVIPILTRFAQQVAEDEREWAAQHQCGDYNGGEYDWICVCGARGHWQEDSEDSWPSHIRKGRTP